jgi:hypothetical protein
MEFGSWTFKGRDFTVVEFCGHEVRNVLDLFILRVYIPLFSNSCSSNPVEFYNRGVLLPSSAAVLEAHIMHISKYLQLMMARVDDILALGGARHGPFDIVLTTLTQLPTIDYRHAESHPHAFASMRDFEKRDWVKSCRKATQWQCVSRTWRQCHREHVRCALIVLIRHKDIAQ